MTPDMFANAATQILCVLLAKPDLDVVSLEVLAAHAVECANALDSALTDDGVIKWQKHRGTRK
jgi:hypothetical protein